MRVVFLGREDSPVLAHLRATEDDLQTIGPAEPFDPAQHAPDIVVSHGYRKILRRAQIEPLEGRIVNLHISLLPWNRGADPTLWCVLEDTPAGVSIHHIDEGVDTGDLIVQRPVALADDDTFATAYAKLQDELAALFRAVWPQIAAGTAPRRRQPPGGSVHRLADREAVAHLLTNGWDTPIGPLRGACAASS